MAKTQFKLRGITNFIVVHCAATKPSMDVGAREIRQWHLQRGFLDIGYHLVIRRDGTVEKGRELDQLGAHVEGHNFESVGVCLVGGIDDKGKPEANFTPEQMSQLKVTLGELQARYPQAKIIGHHGLNPGKACPSFNVGKWLTSGQLVTSDKG